MVNFKFLSYLPNLQSLVIDGVDEIRDINFPLSLKSLEIKNTTLNLNGASGCSIGFFSESTSQYEGGVACCNFRKFVIDNCLIGDYFKDCFAGTRFTSNVAIKIFNSSDLEEFKVNVEFETDELEVTINTGSLYTFDGLNSGTCEINKLTSKGRIITSSGNEESYFYKNCNIVHEPLLNKYFKMYLLQKTTADSNHDTFLSLEELKAITKLEIVYDGHNGNIVDAFHNLDNIEMLENLQELKVDLGASNKDVRYINSIKFPQSGSLKSVRITNTYTAFGYDGGVFGDVPSVETFEYSGNKTVTNPQMVGSISDADIKINDSGRLSSVKLDNSDVQTVVLSNTGTKRNLRLSASGCTKLKSIELQNNGYDLEHVDLSNSVEISKLGYKDNPSENQWTVNCIPDSSGQVIFDVTNCTKFGTDTNNIIVDFGITSGQSGVVIAYGVDRLTNDHKLTIKNGEGDVYIYYSAGSWLETNYNGKQGIKPQAGSSVPNIAIFNTSGSHIRTSAKNGDEPFQRWVDSYDVEINIGSTCQEGLNDIDFYVEESVGNKNIIRKLNYEPSDITLELVDNPGIIKLLFQGDSENLEELKGIGGKKPGRATVNICKGTGDAKKVIGQQNIVVISNVKDVEFTNYHSESGTESDPIHIERKDGELKLSAKLKWGDELLSLPGEMESVLWMFGEYSTRSDTWIDMSASTATSYGINVKAEYEEGEDPNKTYYKVFSFGGYKTFFKVIAQAPLNRDSDYNSYIRRDYFVEITGPCKIDLSADKLIAGSSDAEPVTVTATKCKNVEVTIEDEANYNGLIKLEKDVDACEDYKSVWKLRLNSTDEAAMKSLIDKHDSVTLKIVSDYGVHERVIGLSSAYEPPVETDPDSDTKKPDTPPAETDPDSDTKKPDTPPAETDPDSDTKKPDTPPTETDPDSDTKKPDTPPAETDPDSNNSDTSTESDSHSSSSSERSSDSEEDASSDSSNSNGGQEEQESSDSVTVTSSSGESSQGAQTYTPPEKVTVSERSVVNNDGTTTKLAVHVDGSVSETRTLSAATVLAINSTLAMSTGAPTVINSFDVVIDKGELLLIPK